MQQQKLQGIYIKRNGLFRRDIGPIREFINEQPLVTDVFRQKQDLNLDLDFLIQDKRMRKDVLQSLKEINSAAEIMSNEYKNFKGETKNKLKILATFLQVQINPRPYSYEDKNIYIPKNDFGIPEKYGNKSFNTKNNLFNKRNDEESDIYKLTLFINEDFDGGETTFPNQNLDIKPETFKILFHPSNENYIYGIRPIENGVRMTINCYYKIIKNN